ncbi:MAG: hypothetical protein CSA62_01150 [Planctomycetota bacterium]|nr:MAG: hypothetical protein CSA62_01150 [Planctomycetota bacterium]
MELRNANGAARERGMAHVSIFWALVPMVIMIAALVFAYDRHTSLLETKDEASAAKVAKKSAETELRARDGLLKQITAIVEHVGPYSYEVLDEGRTIDLTEYTAPDKLKVKFQVVRSMFNLGKTNKTLSQFIAGLKTKFDEQKERIAQLEQDLDNARGQKTAAEERLATTLREKDSEIARLNAEKLEEQRKVERSVEEYEGKLASALDQVRRAQDARRKAEEDAQKRIKAKDGEIALRDARLLAAQDKLRLIPSPEKPDGQILASSPRTKLAWINRGSRQMVKRGLTFRVLEVTEKGHKFKANAKVVRVEDDRSEVRILNLKDELNPVVQGDVIANDLYSPNLPRNIMLIGRFVTPLTKDEIKAKLESMGNVVHDKFSPSVDLVVVGREAVGEDAVKIKDMKDYQQAQKLSVEIVPLHRIRDFLRL